MAKNQARKIALSAIFATIVKKKSLRVEVDLSTDKRELALGKSLSFGVVRHYYQLSVIINSYLKKPIDKGDLDIYCILLLGAYQLLFSRVAQHAAIFESVNLSKHVNKTWAKGLINAILQQILRDKDKLLKQNHHNHPNWLVKKIKQAYPDNYQTILEQNNKQAPMVIRVHPKHAINDYQKLLSDAGIASDILSNLPQALVLKKACNVEELPLFEGHAFYVQDGSAQLAAHLLNSKKNSHILDACAAPGGKTLHLAELAPKSSIIALESDEKRLARLQANINKYRYNIKVKHGLAEAKDWWDGILFDSILLDVPCSATGVIRRHPDIKILREKSDINKLVAKQKEILDNTWQLLKHGGKLLYTTCSILPIENSEQMATFLSTHSDAKEILIKGDWVESVDYGKQQLPHEHFDGFYYCLLEKYKP